MANGATGTLVRDLRAASLITEACHFIGGTWATGSTDELIDVINPANGELLARVPRGGEKDIDAAVSAAAAAFPAWRDSGPIARANLLQAWAAAVRAHEEEIDALERLEVGRPSWGPLGIPHQLAYAASLADKVMGQTLPTASPNVIGMTLREPYGVVGSIIPWNSPGPSMMVDVAPALAAGNTIVIKPAEDAPLTPLFLAAIGVEAGIPPGVVNVVTGYGAEAGYGLASHPIVRRIGFTGSPETGMKVMEACAKNLVPLHVELGGKSPQIVLRDAPLDKAIPTIVRSITMNTGQICAAGSRVLVDESLRKELVGALTSEFEKIRIGPWYEEVEMGPLISKRQETRVFGYIDTAQEEGAELVTGGHKPAGEKFERGFFVEPTIFDRVLPDMRIAQEEVFGPVLSILSYEDEEEAVAIANGTRYGLVASIWTSDVGRAVRLARRVEAGQVAVNTTGSRGVIGAPFGGYKHSGFGRTMGADSVLEYTQVKSVILSGEL